MNIVYSSTKLLNIRPLTVVNGNTCYEITDHDAVQHVFTPRSTVFIAVEHAGNIHIFNVKKDGVFPDEFKQYINAIASPQLEPFFNETTSVHTVFDLHNSINDNNPHRFAVINKGRRCPEMMDLTHAQTIVRELNDSLKSKCPDFYLNLDYITSFPKNSRASLYYEIYVNSYFCPKIILCLFTDVNKIKKCVSSIAFNRMSDDEMSISSRTDASYEGRKFNILLRAVAIMISKHIMHTTEALVSNAENVISAFIMLKWFNAMKINAMNQRVRMPHDDDLFNTLTRYFQTYQIMETHVELNEANIENASRVFHETIARMNCKPLPRRSSSAPRSRSRSHSRSRYRSASAGGKRKTRKSRKPRHACYCVV
jgi:hypothetical protein